MELPCSQRVFEPPLKKPMLPVLLKISAALFCTPPARMLLPKLPEESITPPPPRLKRRSVETDGVWVCWRILEFDPIYCNVPLELAVPRTRLPAALLDQPRELFGPILVLTVADPVAACDRVTVVPLIAVIVVPAGILGLYPKVWPTRRPALLPTVTEAVPAVVWTVVVAAGPLMAGIAVTAKTPWAMVVTPV